MSDGDLASESRASESRVRVARPSRASEYRDRAARPSRSSESRDRVARPSCSSESRVWQGLSWGLTKGPDQRAWPKGLAKGPGFQVDARRGRPAP